MLLFVFNIFDFYITFLLFGTLGYNDLKFIVTTIELAGTEKLFTLLMKRFVSFIYEGISFTTG